MHSPTPSRFVRIAAGVLIAGLLAPATGRAEDAAPAEPVPVESHWYDGPVHTADVAADLVVIRPLAAVTLVVGAVLFVPAAIMTAPNGRDGVKDAYDRFVREPGEYVYSRPLGEF
jgi:hypothetical protein